MARRQAALKLPDVRDQTTIFGAKFGSQGITPGGWDILTPNLSLHAGALRDIQNFEVNQNGGYSRIGGYERFNGLPSPSDASFVIVQVTSFVNVPSVGRAIQQAGSGATGTVALVNNVVGAYYMVVTETVGSFNATGVVSGINNSYTVTSANPLTVTSATSPFTVPYTATTIGTATTTTIQLTSLLNAQYQVAAADIYRDAIDAVPGSGPVLGVVYMNFTAQPQGSANVYAFRANGGATAVAIWKSTAAGWVNIPLFNVVSFTACGTADPQDGDTLTQGPASAIIKRVMLSGGTIAGSTAAGTFVVANPNLGFSAGAATTSSGATLTLSGAQMPIVILPQGNYEFCKYNFGGQAITRRIYGCDGVNQAFEFDGTIYAPIVTGLSPDVPSHIACHKQHLFLSQGSSYIHSGPGTPYRFGATDFGGEEATGDIITNMLTLPGAQTTAALGIWMHATTGILYGTDLETFNFVVFNAGTGANDRSVQNLFDTLAFPDLGVVNLQASLVYGNFVPTTLTKNIQTFINQENGSISASSISRGKGQYRVFFTDGYGLYLTLANQSYLGAAKVLFPNPVNCIDTDVGSDGEEVSFFGATDSLGYVYQLDKGPSFDGEILFAYIRGAFDYLKTPRFLKRFFCASIELQGSAYAAIDFSYALSDNTSLVGQPTGTNYASGFSPAIWDQFTWDNFYWDGSTTMPTYSDMPGTGYNVQPVIGCSTNYIQPFTVSSIIYQFVFRRRLRGL